MSPSPGSLSERLASLSAQVPCLLLRIEGYYRLSDPDFFGGASEIRLLFVAALGWPAEPPSPSERPLWLKDLGADLLRAAAGLGRRGYPLIAESPLSSPLADPMFPPFFASSQMRFQFGSFLPSDRPDRILLDIAQERLAAPIAEALRAQMLPPWPLSSPRDLGTDDELRALEAFLQRLLLSRCSGSGRIPDARRAL